MSLEENRFNICLNCGYVFIHPDLKRKIDFSWSTDKKFLDYLEYMDFKPDAQIFKESIFVCPKCGSDAITEKDKKELVKSVEEKSKRGIEQLGDVFNNKPATPRSMIAPVPSMYNPSPVTKLKFTKKLETD